MTTLLNDSRKQYLLFMYEIIKSQQRSHVKTVLSRVRAIFQFLRSNDIKADFNALKDHLFRNDPFKLPVSKEEWKEMRKAASKESKEPKPPSGNHVGRTRHRQYTFEEVKEAAIANKLYWNDRKVSLRRIHILHHIGFKCQHCDRIGVTWFLEENRAKQLHLDLYAEDGVMMTIDHITPKSKGGKNEMSNYQCLCKICNETKGNSHCH